MLQDEAILAIHSCGVHRNIAEAVVRVCVTDEELKKAVTSPSWALFNYWKYREQGCETGEELAAALRNFGFREEVVSKVPKEKKFGHLSARGWARHIDQDVHTTCSE